MLSVSSKRLRNKSLTSSVSTSASRVGNNSNIFVDILHCLPVKSLCAFKTVSKQWLTIISDPCFERNYNIHCRSSFTPALFMTKTLVSEDGITESDFETLVMDERNTGDYVPFVTPIPVKAGKRLHFQQSCHGLLLCSIEDGNWYTPYVVYNPSMRHYKNLPSPPIRITGAPCVLSVSIALDPAKSSHYEAVYVCITDYNIEILHIEIYSPKTNSWRDVGKPFPFSKPGKLFGSGVYCNGSVHWIDESTGTLHYFDIDCELMKEISLPMEPNHKEHSRKEFVRFSECRGHVHLMEMRKDDRLRFDIWEMRVDYSGWNVKSYVDLSPLLTAYPCYDRSFFSKYFNLDVLLVEEDKDSSILRLILSIAEDKVVSFDRTKWYRLTLRIRVLRKCMMLKRIFGYKDLNISKHLFMRDKSGVSMPKKK